MSSEAENLKIIAEVVDKFSKPLQDLRKQLQATGGDAKNKQLERSYEDIRKSVRGLRDEVKGGLTPALAVFGLTAFSVGGAMAAVASSLRTFASSTNSLSLLRRETGLTIDTMRQWESFAARMGSTPDAMRAGMSAFARNMQELRKGIGGTYSWFLTGDENVRNFGNSLRGVTSNEEALKRVFKFLDRMPNAKHRQDLLSASGLQPELGRVTGDEREKLLDEIKKDLGTTTKEAQEAAEKFEAAMARMQDSWSGLQTALGNSGALDEITKVLKKLREFTSENQEEFGKGATKFFREVGNEAKTAWGWMQKVADSLNEMKAESKDVKPWVDIPKFFRNSGMANKSVEELSKQRHHGPSSLFPDPTFKERFTGEQEDQKKATKEGTKEGASEGVQEGIRKMMLEGRPGGNFGEGARVWKASYGGGEGYGGGGGGGGGGGDGMGRGVGGDGGGGGGVKGRGDDPRGVLSHIREAAIKARINPDLMERVARGEGLNAAYGTGDRGTSFGSMQLHRGGRGSVGTEFEKETGLNLADPKNEHATIDYAAKWIAKHGWGAWMGARAAGITGRMGVGGDMSKWVNQDGSIKSPVAGGGSPIEGIQRALKGYDSSGLAIKGKGANLADLNPELRARFEAMWGAAPEEAKKGAGITSGWRSFNEQAKLRRRYEAGGPLAARAGHSNHEGGNAGDWRDPSGWFHNHAREYGVNFPLGRRDWPHAQMDPKYRGPDFLDREAERSRLVGNTQDDEKRQNERNRLFDSAANSGVLGGPANLDGNAKLQIDLNGFPKGTKIQTQTDGIFTDVELKRGRSMPLSETE